MKLSTNLTLAEYSKSQYAIRHGIDNEPKDEHLENAKFWATNMFQPVRNWVGGSLAVTSGYRSPKLNKGIGGSRTSDHCRALAGDMDADVFGNSTNNEIFFYIKDNMIFDQIIAEFPVKGKISWVHGGVRKEKNRYSVLIAIKVKNDEGELETDYIPFKGNEHLIYSS